MSVGMGKFLYEVGKFQFQFLTGVELVELPVPVSQSGGVGGTCSSSSSSGVEL